MQFNPSHPPLVHSRPSKKNWCPHVVTWILSRSHLRFDTQSQSNGGPRRGCQRLGGQIFFVWALAIMAGSGSDGTVNEGCPLWCLMPTNLTTSVDSTVLGKVHNAAVDLTWSDGCQVFFTRNIMQITLFLEKLWLFHQKIRTFANETCIWNEALGDSVAHLIEKTLQNNCTWSQDLITWNLQIHYIIRTHRNTSTLASMLP